MRIMAGVKEKDIIEINEEEFMPQIAISQLTYNQTDIKVLLKQELSSCTLSHNFLKQMYADYPSVTSACDLAEREIDRVNKRLKDIGEIVQEKAEGVEKALKQYYADEMECIKVLKNSRWN